MGIYYFTEDQVEELKRNPNVKSVSIKGITYHKHFKDYFLIEYAKGKLPRQIFIEAGFKISSFKASFLI